MSDSEWRISQEFFRGTPKTIIEHSYKNKHDHDTDRPQTSLNSMASRVALTDKCFAPTDSSPLLGVRTACFGLGGVHILSRLSNEPTTR